MAVGKIMYLEENEVPKDQPIIHRNASHASRILSYVISISLPRSLS